MGSRERAISRTCGLIINAQLDKKEAMEVFNNVLKVVGKYWKKESPNNKITVGDTLPVASINTDSMISEKLKSVRKKNNPGIGSEISRNQATGGASGIGDQSASGTEDQSTDYNQQGGGTCDPSSPGYDPRNC